MKYLEKVRKQLALCLMIAVGAGSLSTRSMAEAYDPDLTDEHRVETISERPDAEPSGGKERTDQKSATKNNSQADAKPQALLYDTLEAMLAHNTGNTPLRDKLSKLLAEIPHASNDVIYKKVHAVLKEFSQEADTMLYRSVSGILRQFRPIEYQQSFMPCAVTPSLKPSFVPEYPILKNGNLLRKEGESRRALGQYIRIVGRVLDESCLPVENAVVEIWQADHTGKNENDYIIPNVWDRKDPDYDRYFAYSGTAQTNNLGEFSFLTIFPGVLDAHDSKEQEAPHINVRVSHPVFEALTTRLYFVNHPRNDNDAVLQSLNAGEKTGRKDVRDLVMMEGKALDPTHTYEGRIYRKTLVLRGVDPYKQY